MAGTQHSNLFESGFPRGETIMPVWRRGFRAAMCRGRGAGSWAAPEHRGNETEVMLPPSRVRLAPTSWHRQASSPPLSRATYPEPLPGSSPPGFSTTMLPVITRASPADATPLDCRTTAHTHGRASINECRETIGNDHEPGNHPGPGWTTLAPQGLSLSPLRGASRPFSFA